MPDANLTSLRCHEWDTHQSYRRDRAAPPWIKVHRNIMQNRKWARLTDAEKGQLVSIWVLAADRDGEVPNDPFLLKKICMLDAEPDVQRFIDLGLLTPVRRQRDVNVTSRRRHDDAPEAEAEAEERRGEKQPGSSADEPQAETDDNFERLWAKRPRRAGSDPKHEARKAWNARMREKCDPQAIEAGLERYARFCEATGKIQTEKVMQFATFVGPSRRWEESFDLPKRNRSISDDNQQAIARAMGER